MTSYAPAKFSFKNDLKVVEHERLKFRSFITCSKRMLTRYRAIRKNCDDFIRAPLLFEFQWLFEIQRDFYDNTPHGLSFLHHIPLTGFWVSQNTCNKMRSFVRHFQYFHNFYITRNISYSYLIVFIPKLKNTLILQKHEKKKSIKDVDKRKFNGTLSQKKISKSYRAWKITRSA